MSDDELDEEELKEMDYINERLQQAIDDRLLTLDNINEIVNNV